MSPRNFGAELLNGIHRRIDVPPDESLRIRQKIHDVTESDVADDEEVNVAGVLQLVACCRTEDECHVDAAIQGPKRLSHDVHEPGRLREERLKLGEDRRRPVGLKIHLPPVLRAAHEPGADQHRELALNGSR